jgi:hypothetical protein
LEWFEEASNGWWAARIGILEAQIQKDAVGILFPWIRVASAGVEKARDRGQFLVMPTT